MKNIKKELKVEVIGEVDLKRLTKAELALLVDSFIARREEEKAKASRKDDTQEKVYKSPSERLHLK